MYVSSAIVHKFLCVCVQVLYLQRFSSEAAVSHSHHEVLDPRRSGRRGRRRPPGIRCSPSPLRSSEEIAILRNDFVIEDDGRYNFDAETANGIVVSEHGTPGLEGAINSAGSFSYTAPDGTDVHLQFVADENGFQPQGAHLPVAPSSPPEYNVDLKNKNKIKEKNLEVSSERECIWTPFCSGILLQWPSNRKDNKTEE
nr:uncharacterized protein LOC113830224 [Penaeus vannamei]